jgi:hypothetical protein
VKKIQFKKESAPGTQTPISDRLRSAGSGSVGMAISGGGSGGDVVKRSDLEACRAHATPIPMETWTSVPDYHLQREPLYIIAPKELSQSLEMMVRFEDALRHRMDRPDIFVFPYGTELSAMKKSDDAVAVVQCKHCGQWAARYTACRSCGAPVE